jgi:hypothetical protein
MFLLNGKPLSPDRAFTDIHGIQRPANWLRLASHEERLKAGVTECSDPPVWDQRFAWGYNADGKLIWKDHGQLVEQWSEQTRATANSLLAPSDWMVIREADNGVVIPLEVKAYRQVIREKCGQKVSAIAATTTTEELAAYVTGNSYPEWINPAPPTSADEVVNDFTSIDGVTDGAILSGSPLYSSTGEDTVIL